MTNIKLNSKSLDSVGADFLQNLPATGIFEGTYACPEEKIKQDARDKSG